jgi:hypothetical protein
MMMMMRMMPAPWSGLWKPLAWWAGSTCTSHREKPTWPSEVSGNKSQDTIPHLVNQEIGKVFWPQLDFLEKGNYKYIRSCVQLFTSKLLKIFSVSFFFFL